MVICQPRKSKNLSLSCDHYNKHGIFAARSNLFLSGTFSFLSGAFIFLSAGNHGNVSTLEIIKMSRAFYLIKTK